MSLALSSTVALPSAPSVFCGRLAVMTASVATPVAPVGGHPVGHDVVGRPACGGSSISSCQGAEPEDAAETESPASLVVGGRAVTGGQSEMRPAPALAVTMDFTLLAASGV